MSGPKLPSSLDIARSVTPRPIIELAHELVSLRLQVLGQLGEVDRQLPAARVGGEELPQTIALLAEQLDHPADPG